MASIILHSKPRERERERVSKREGGRKGGIKGKEGEREERDQVLMIHCKVLCSNMI